MHIGKKNINYEYSMNGDVFESVEAERILGSWYHMIWKHRFTKMITQVKHLSSEIRSMDSWRT